MLKYSCQQLWRFSFVLQALFGVQFVLSVVMATMLQKFSPYISLARWILCNEQYVLLLAKGSHVYMYIELRFLIDCPVAKTKTIRMASHNNHIQQHNELIRTQCNNWHWCLGVNFHKNKQTNKWTKRSQDWLGARLIDRVGVRELYSILKQNRLVAILD